MTADLLALTGFFGERSRHAGRYVADALLATRPIDAAVVLRGAAGFGPRHEVRSDLTLSMSEDPPVAVVAVDTADRIAAMAERAAEAIARGTLVVQRLRGADDSALPTYVELTVHTGRAQRVDGRPAHVAICELLRRGGFASATTLLGVDGVVAGRRCRARFVGRNGEVPVLTVAVGPGAAAEAAVPLLREVLPSALVTVQPVELCVAPGLPVRRPTALPAADEHDGARWQKVTIHTTEADLHDGVPVHRALLRRLRDSPTAAGMTVLRGVWGFTGSRQPQGDRVFQLGRRVPVTTHYIDTADQVAAAFDVVAEIVGRDAVVTSAAVAAVVSIDGGRRRGSTGFTPPPGR